MLGNDKTRKLRLAAGGNLLQAELLQEKAANLGRLSRRLERALAALREHDEAVGRRPEGRSAAAAVPRGRHPAPARGSDEPRRPASDPVAEAVDRAGTAPDPAAERRSELLADACEALFLYVVQREVLGLSGTAQVLDDLGVPREVRLRMAPRSVLLAR